MKIQLENQEGKFVLQKNSKNAPIASSSHAAMFQGVETGFFTWILDLFPLGR